LKKALIERRISMGHARALLSLSSSDDQQDSLDEILQRNLSVRQTEELVQSKKAQENQTVKISKPVEIRTAEDQLRQTLKTKVLIFSNKKCRGRISIEFYSKQDLMRIMDFFEKLNEKECS
ncbi:MAG: chromosome partitioning protein ParB, partial [Deltaproteobacteria bacterium]|nr:chromosome partitioning protein ParB [Deltaproteobacteria bacterium]